MGFKHGTKFQWQMENWSRPLGLVLKWFNFRYHIWTISKRQTQAGYIFTSSINHSWGSAAPKQQPVPIALGLALNSSLLLCESEYMLNHQWSRGLSRTWYALPEAWWEEKEVRLEEREEGKRPQRRKRQSPEYSTLKPEQMYFDKHVSCVNFRNTISFL